MNIAKSPTSLINQDLLTIHQNLHSQLMALSFDDSFLPRLLRETGWTTDQCDRTIQEYKRFLFLHRTANHTVVPSQMVDKVWHLHLLYTRSYWEDLCDNILKTPLHHHPGSASGDQRHFFWGNYEATLKSYETTFHHCPPADIWPEPAIQFACPPKAPHLSRLKLAASKFALPKFALPKLALPELPNWVYYTAIALLSGIVAIALHIDILANLVNILKYGLITVASLSFIKYLRNTYDTILRADYLIKIPLEINPRNRREVDSEKNSMATLATNHTNASKQVIISIVAACTAIYVQACQTTNSLYLFHSDLWWGYLILGYMFLLFAIMIALTLDSIISKNLLQGLRRSKTVTLADQSYPSCWNTEVYKGRRRICKDCANPVEYLKLDNFDQFLTEKEQFAKNLRSINITHSHDHCAKCSPAPARDNLLLRITPKNNYVKCPKCETIARKTTTKILHAATTDHEGEELISEDCAYCQDHSEKTRKIPQIQSTCDGCNGCI